jgi:hypothetical protein
MSLFGRAELVESVARNEARVLLVTGDSGIGKSSVLQASCAPRDGWVLPAPITAVRSSGALYAAYLDALGAALAELLQAGIAGPTFSERMIELGRRVGNEQLSVLGRVAFDELVAVIRGRVGDQVGIAITDFVSENMPDNVARLAARASSARDPLAYEILSAFAETAADLAEDRQIGLSLDQAERLTEDDLRLVADLAEHLPAQVHLRLAYATDDVERTQKVVSLRAGSSTIDTMEVPALTEVDVGEWLEAASLDPNLAGPVTQQSGGYPLLVETAIAHLKGGGELTEVPRHEQLMRRTQVSWQRLSPEARAVARKLAVLPDPLPEHELRELVGVTDVGQWATVIEELRESRIFSVTVNGQTWFHAERRRFVLSDCLTAEQRDEAATAAAGFLWAQGFRTTDFAAVARFAQVAALAPTYQAKEPHLAAAAALDYEGLAVAAALLELAVEGKMSANADSLLSHALTFTDRIDAPITTIEAMVEADLVVTASNEWMTVVVAGWGPKTQAFLQGRAGVELRRSPVPQIVQVMFSLALGDRLGEFEKAQLGIGSPSIGSLGRIAAGADADIGYVNRRELGHNLLVQGSLVGDVPFWLAVSYPTAESRDHALAEVAGLNVESPIGTVSVRRVSAHPTEPVPVQRFARALERGRHDRAAHIRDRGDIKLPPPAGLDDNDLANERARAAEVLSGLASPAERSAMELDDGYLFVWAAEDNHWAECVVCGTGSFDARPLPALLEGDFHDHYEGLRIRQALHLSPLESVVHHHFSAGENTRRDPLASEVAYRRSRAAKFNGGQPQLFITLEKHFLSERLDSAFKAELRAARAMRQEFPLSTSDGARIGPRALWLLIVLDEPDPHWVAGARGMAIYSEGSSPDDDDHVYVEFVQGQGDEHGYLYSVEDQVFERAFPNASPSELSGTSTIDSIVARLLGHHPDDMRLVWPGDLTTS